MLSNGCQAFERLSFGEGCRRFGVSYAIWH